MKQKSLTTVVIAASTLRARRCSPSAGPSKATFRYQSRAPRHGWVARRPRRVLRVLCVDIHGGLFTAQVQLAQAPQRSARLPRLRPRHPTGDGEEAPTTQTQVTTVVIPTAGAERREPGRRTMAAPHMQPALTMVTLGTP
jgi:hypothetical protein